MRGRGFIILHIFIVPYALTYLLFSVLMTVHNLPSISIHNFAQLCAMKDASLGVVYCCRLVRKPLSATACLPHANFSICTDLIDGSNEALLMLNYVLLHLHMERFATHLKRIQNFILCLFFFYLETAVFVLSLYIYFSFFAELLFVCHIA